MDNSRITSMLGGGQRSRGDFIFIPPSHDTVAIYCGLSQMCPRPYASLTPRFHGCVSPSVSIHPVAVRRSPPDLLCVRVRASRGPMTETTRHGMQPMPTPYDGGTNATPPPEQHVTMRVRVGSCSHRAGGPRLHCTSAT
jgi:hypothetical protein